MQSIRDLVNSVGKGRLAGADKTARVKIMDAIKGDLEAFDVANGTNIAEALKVARDESYLLRRLEPLNSLFRQSTIKPQGIGEVELFNLAAFTKKWEQVKNQWIANKTMFPEEIKLIDEFATKMEAMGPDIGKLAAFEAKQKAPILSSSGFAQGTIGSPYGMALGAMKSPFLVLPAGIIDWRLGRSLLHPNGVARRFLTTGFGPPTLSTKMGLMKGMEEMVSD